MSEFESLVFYIIMISISTLLFCSYRSNNNLVAKVGVGLSVIIPSIVAGMRYYVGTDYKTYYYIFDSLRKCSYNWILTDSWHFNEERGFLILSKLFSDIFGPKALFGIYALFMLSLFIVTILTQYRNINLPLTYFIFLCGQYFASFNTLRQSLAMVILFYGMKYVFEGNKIKYGISILLAMIFHTTSILVVPIYFLWNHKRERELELWKKIIIYIIVAAAVIFWKQILTAISVVFNNFYLTKYTTYLEGNDTQNRSFYLKLIIGIIIYFTKEKYRILDQRLATFVNMYIIGVILEYTGFYITFVKRIGDYYGAYAGIVLFGAMPCTFYENKNNIIIKLVIAAYEIALFTIVSYIMGQGGYFPYRI